MAQEKLAYFAINGGEDLVSPPLTVSPSSPALALNYECDSNGRLRRINGYERFDGRTIADVSERDDIEALPGAGPVRGVWHYGGNVYAFRNATDNLSCKMFKGTAAGWVEVTTPSLAPSGRYEFCNANVLGTGSGEKMYGCDGKNKAFQYDGTTFAQIATGYATDTPAHIFSHKLHLFVAMLDGYVQHSGLKVPTSFDVADGAGAIGVGDLIVGFEMAADGALVLLGKNSTHIVYGNSSSDWSITTLPSNSGAVEYTAQRISAPVYLDAFGITTISAVQEYGNFATNALSFRVKPYIDEKRALVVASLVCRGKNQYRLFFSDGTGSVMTIYNSGDGLGYGFTRIKYHDAVACCCSVEDGAGEEAMFFGDNSGMVYRLDSGNSFDGEAIVSKLSTHYNNLKTPRNIKRVLKVVAEMECDGQVSVVMRVRFQRSSGIASDLISDVDIQTGGGAWGEVKWGDFVWYVGSIGYAHLYVNGSGLGFSIAMKTDDETDHPFTVNGFMVHYVPRGMQR